MFRGGEAALGPVVAGGLGGCRLKMNCRPSLNYMSSASLLPLRSVSTVAFRHSKFNFDVKFRVNSFYLICCSQVVFGNVNFTSILHHLLEMLLGSHLRVTMSVLCCFSLDVLRLTGAAPTTERPITTEQCPGRRLQIPPIFLHTSDSHLCLNCFSDQPNDTEVDTATAKRLYTCCITYYYTFTSIH